MWRWTRIALIISLQVFTIRNFYRPSVHSSVLVVHCSVLRPSKERVRHDNGCVHKFGSFYRSASRAVATGSATGSATDPTRRVGSCWSSPTPSRSRRQQVMVEYTPIPTPVYISLDFVGMLRGRGGSVCFAVELGDDDAHDSNGLVFDLPQSTSSTNLSQHSIRRG